MGTMEMIVGALTVAVLALAGVVAYLWRSISSPSTPEEKIRKAATNTADLERISAKVNVEMSEDRAKGWIDIYETTHRRYRARGSMDDE